ncbi:hypothetical protein C1645_812784 [Glomus cerebriforme]|uniref:Uncharacterized protein n=1 Tax=Glomus cerebriforme TaxID=658196 RepID=A0A397TJH8_9GLOM|nr:hypothetical protein C1645_812784 [Glomus cerebriforme]
MASSGARETTAGNLQHARLSEVYGWNNNIDEIDENKEFVIEMRKNLVNTSLQASFEMITLEDGSFFEIELNLFMCNSEFVDFDKKDYWD